MTYRYDDPQDLFDQFNIAQTVVPVGDNDEKVSILVTERKVILSDVYVPR